MRDEERPRPGTVYLVGWGPEGEDLTTARALALVRGATRAFTYPGLPASALHAFSAGATVRELVSAAELVDAARGDGGVLVLYPGDPVLDAPGAEHAAAVEAAGLALEIVPGVSRALWACVAAGVLPPPAARLDLRAPPAGLLSIARRAAGEAACDLEAVHAALTPALGVGAAGTPGQHLRPGTLATLPVAGPQRVLAGEEFLLVGPMAARRLPWLERRPLHGRGIILTRPRGQAAGLARLLRRGGARVLEFPTIAAVGIQDPGPAEAAIADLHHRDWVIFTSANGVAFFFARLLALRRDARAFGASRLAAIGPATAAALAGHGLRADVVPEQYQAEGLIAALGGEELRGARILIPRAQVARDTLPETLRARGAEVDVVPIYRTVRPVADVDALRRALDAGEVHAVTFTSSSTVRHFCSYFAAGEAAQRLAVRSVTVACIGPITAATARDLGLEVRVTAEEFTAEGLAAALASHFAGAG